MAELIDKLNKETQERTESERLQKIEQDLIEQEYNENEAPSVINMIIEMGGINDSFYSGEMKMFSFKESGIKGIINKSSKTSFARMAESIAERTGNENHRDASWLIDAIANEIPRFKRNENRFKAEETGAIKENREKAIQSENFKKWFGDWNFFIANDKIKNEFETAVAEAINNPDNNQKIELGTLPPLLKEIFKKRGILNNPTLKTNQKAIRKGLGIQKNEKHNHNVPRNVMNKLPELIYNPIAVFRSLSTSDNPNGYVVVSNEVDANGKPIVIIVSPSKDMNGFNFIPTIYEKKYFNKFIENTAKEGKIIYIKEKGSDIWGKLQSLPRHIQNLNKTILFKKNFVNNV